MCTHVHIHMFIKTELLHAPLRRPGTPQHTYIPRMPMHHTYAAAMAFYCCC